MVSCVSVGTILGHRERASRMRHVTLVFIVCQSSRLRFSFFDFDALYKGGCAQLAAVCDECHQSAHQPFVLSFVVS